jgi:hypothetical protein
MSNVRDKVPIGHNRKPEAVNICDLNEDDENSVNQREISRRAVADATRAFEKFADELN